MALCLEVFGAEAPCFSLPVLVALLFGVPFWGALSGSSRSARHLQGFCHDHAACSAFQL